MDKETIRINFKGGSLKGLSTNIQDPYVTYKGELYKLEVTSKTITGLRYKFMGKFYEINHLNICA